MYFPERPLDPPEPHLEDLTVTIEGNSRGTLSEITDVIGGDAHWTSDRPIEDDWREFHADIVVPDCEDYSTAEDITHNLFSEHLSDTVDLDNLIVTVDYVEDYEPDWDSIRKDSLIDW